MSSPQAPVDSHFPKRGAGIHPHPMSLTDGCPECVANVETPSSTYVTDDGTFANYVCLDCGHPWSTSWKD